MNGVDDRFVDWAAMNLCPCCHYGDPIKPCTCAPATVTEYQKLSDDRLGEASERIRQGVQSARGPQSESRQSHSEKSSVGSLTVVWNADMPVAEIRQLCRLNGAGRACCGRRPDWMETT